MFLESGISVAVANATKDLLKVASEVTDTNDNDRVAKYLDK